ncbi:MAG: Lrp/AsnC family transcriptional regulator [Candidatus Bathyarchaeia archaeon]
MDKIDESLLSELTQGIPLTTQPFNVIAEKIGISPEEVLKRLVKLKESGIIRRFGASIKPNDIGFTANAVIAWKVPLERVNEIGTYLSSFREVTHCYERSPIPERWEYNLYMVMHALERGTIEETTKLLAETVGIQDYVILYSKRDLKNGKTKQDKP